MPVRLTIEAIYLLRQLMEKYRDKYLHMIFINLEKTYDRVPREINQWVLGIENGSQIDILTKLRMCMMKR